MKRTYRYTWLLVSMIASFVVPVGLWYLSEKMLLFELVDEAYIYITVVCAFGFGLLGFIAGYYADKASLLELSDALTGMNARHILLDHLDRLVFNNTEYGEGFCLIFFDCDGLKKMNEKHGRKVGDHILSVVSTVIKKQITRQDIAGRYHDDKFILLCPQKERNECAGLAEKICKNVKKISRKKVDVDQPQTLTAAVYEPPPGLRASTGELLKLVKRMTEDGKNQGGDRVIS